MKRTVILVLIVLLALLTLASCERSKTIVKPCSMSSKKPNSGELHNMKLDEMLYALEQIRDSETTLNKEEYEEFMQNQLQQMLLCDAIFSTTECYNDFVDMWDIRPIYTDMHDLVEYYETEVNTAYLKSVIEYDEKLLIDGLLQILLNSSNDIKDDIVDLSELYNEAIIKGFEEKHPIYYNVIEIAYHSTIYWEQNANRWNQVFSDLYDGDGDPTQINDIRLIWGADAGGAILGGLAGIINGDSTGSIIIGIVGGAVTGSSTLPGQIFYGLATLMLQKAF